MGDREFPFDARGPGWCRDVRTSECERFSLLVPGLGRDDALRGVGLGRKTRTKTLDFAIASVLCVIVCGTFAFLGASQIAVGSSLASATTMAYLVGDFLLLSLVVGGTYGLGRRATQQWFLVAGAISVIVLGETMRVLQNAHSAIGLTRVTWLAGLILLAAAIWCRPRRTLA
jgi:hypothetical protein